LTIHCKLLAKEHDFGGYIIYVFENLDDASFGHRYIMTTRWSNWEHKNIEIGEIGYLTYKEVIAGQDTWYDGSKFIPYNYTNIIFIRFVKENKDNSSLDIII
jgi:hypothetical protein